MPYSNGRIYIDTTTTPPEGISLTDLRKFFGVSGKGLGQIMTNILSRNLVNKWSKVKPIDSGSVKPLMGDEFRKTPARWEAGIRYGLYASGWTWQSVHDATWEYIGYPNNPDLALSQYGGVAPNSRFRIQDFNGYNHKAVPTLSAALSGLLNTDQDNMQITTTVTTNNKPFTAVLQWNDDDTGVDILDALNHSETDNLYLCINIGNYVGVMLNADAGNIITPIIYNSNKAVRFTSMTFTAAMISALNGKTVKGSLFLSPLNLSGTQASIKAGTWVNITGLSISGDIVAMPNAIGYDVLFTTTTVNYGVANLSFVVAPNKDMTVSVFWTTRPDQAFTYRISLELTPKKASVGAGGVQFTDIFTSDGSTSYSEVIGNGENLTGEYVYTVKLTAINASSGASLGSAGTISGDIDFGTSGTN